MKILLSEEDKELLNFKWTLDKSNGYLVRNNKGKREYLHRVILDVKKGQYVDHKNGNKLDNRRGNLRICTNAQNAMNRGRQINNKSGFKGIYWDYTNKKWRVSIKTNGKVINLGRYSDKLYAAKKYNEAAIKYHGEFAVLN